MKTKKILAGALAISMVLSTVGCGNVFKRYKTNGSALTIWAEASTTKIVRDDAGKAVKNASDKDVLKINMAKNESEGVQLMMYAKKDISSYTVEVSDLEAKDAVISKDAIDIYMMKYMVSESMRDIANEAFAEGEIPDPLLPFDTSVEYGENVIAKKQNQSIFLDVETNKDTKAGVYKGVVTVKAEKEKYTIPMEVAVYDVELPDTASLSTIFTIFDRDHFTTAELDASDEQTALYFETLLEYNMSTPLPFEGEGQIETYLELLKKYYDYPGFNAYRLYYNTTPAVYNGQYGNYDVPLYKEYIRAIAQMSVEDKVNYLDKAYSYFYTVVDEPSTEAQFLTAKKNLDIYQMLLSDCDAELRELYAGTEGYEYYVSVVSDTLLNIPNILPCTYDILADMEKYGLQDITFVVNTNNMETESIREKYKTATEGKELWLYSALGPYYPYPSAHTDDYCLGWRLTPWMCFEYDWTGFLYWASVDYLWQEYGDPISDPWSEMYGGLISPGDGRFFYPGEKYGLDTPCPSLRAMAWRDGVDDYSVLEVVKNIFAEYDMDENEALQELYNQVYTEVIPITDSDVFEATREQLFGLIEDLNSKVGILYKEINLGFDSAEVVFKCVSEDAQVSVDGKKLKVDEDGYYRYTADLEESNACTIKVTCGKERKEYTRTFMEGSLGTVNSFEDGGKAGDYISSSSKGYEASIDQKAQFAQEGSSAIHMVINKDKENTLPYFAITKDSKLIGGSWEGITGMKFYLYNPSSENIQMNVSYYINTDTTVNNFTLTAGEWTLIEFNMPQTVKNVEDIVEFDFNFESGSAVELYLDRFVTVLEGGE